MRRKALRRVGKIRGIVEGKLILDGEILPKLGEKVYDSSMREVGVVLSVLGPKNRFFIEVKPSKKAMELSKGQPLYLKED